MNDQNPRPLGHPVERFDPLLRELLEFGLVDEHAGTWSLHPEIGRRLGALASTRRPVVTPLVRFGHGCDACHLNGPTRLHDGRYLCPACLSRAEDDDAGPRRLVARYRDPGSATG